MLKNMTGRGSVSAIPPKWLATAGYGLILVGIVF